MVCSLGRRSKSRKASERVILFTGYAQQRLTSAVSDAKHSLDRMVRLLFFTHEAMDEEAPFPFPLFSLVQSTRMTLFRSRSGAPSKLEARDTLNHCLQQRYRHAPKPY